MSDVGMWRYIVTHWQGGQSLPRSVLLNWLLVYLLLMLVAGLAEVFSIGGPLVWVFLGAMLVWLVWAIVGIVRCGGKILADRDASWPRKAGAAAAILVAAAFSIVVARDLYHLFHATRVPPDAGVRAARLAGGEKVTMDFGTPRSKMAPAMLDPAARTARP